MSTKRKPLERNVDPQKLKWSCNVGLGRGDPFPRNVSRFSKTAEYSILLNPSAFTHICQGWSLILLFCHRCAEFRNATWEVLERRWCFASEGPHTFRWPQRCQKKRQDPNDLSWPAGQKPLFLEHSRTITFENLHLQGISNCHVWLQKGTAISHQPT